MARKAGLVGGPMLAANLMMAATAGQFTLGVLTLLNGVPVGMEFILLDSRQSSRTDSQF